MSLTLTRCPERELLVYGPRKAGTTLLQNLLDGGGSVLMMPGELKLKALSGEVPAAAEFRDFYFRRGRTYFAGLVDADGRAGEAAEYSLQPLDEAQTRAYFDTAGYRDIVRDLLEEPAAPPESLMRQDVAAFLSSIRRPAGEYTYWASKEVGGDPAGVVRTFRRLFPAGRVVFLVREPRLIVRSIIQDRKKRGIPHGPRDVLYECREAQRLIRYVYEEAAGREIVVSYEELTADTPGVMREVARRLEIPFDDVLTAPTTLGMPVVVRTSSRATTTVFRSDGDWTRDLAPWEASIIRWFHAVAPAVYRLGGQRYVTYEELQERLAERSGKDAPAAHE